MGLVDHDEEIVGEIVDEGGRRLAGLAPGQMAGIVFDALAAAHLFEHFQIIERPLRQALLLYQAICGVQLDQPLAQFFLDTGHGAHQIVARGHVMRARKDRHLVELAQDLAAQGIDLGNSFDLIAPPFDAQGFLALVGREDFDHVAAHAEGAAGKVHVVALVLDLDQAAQDGIAPDLDPDREIDLHAQIRLGRADAVDARHRGHDDGIPPRKQRIGRRVAHAIDLFVDQRILLDVRVGRRHVGLGLVVVVVADEEVDRVVGEKTLELAEQLVRQGLVVRDHQRRALHLLDDLGHGEGLAAAGDAEQNLRGISALDSGHKFVDSARLVAGRLQIGDEFEGRGHGDNVGIRRSTFGSGHAKTRISWRPECKATMQFWMCRDLLSISRRRVAMPANFLRPSRAVCNFGPSSLVSRRSANSGTPCGRCAARTAYPCV